MSGFSSIQALLAGTIDYAGTFPPAALSLESALTKNATFRKSANHPFLLGRMVLPLNEIKKLNSSVLYSNDADGTPWLFTALSSIKAVESIGDLLKQLQWDLKELKHLHRRQFDSSCRQLIVSYEMKWPENLQLEDDALSAVFDFFSESQLFDAFIELSWKGEWKNNVQILSEATSYWMESNTNDLFRPGLKLRTGGEYVPTSIELAEAIEITAMSGLKFKATQGLHHALSQKGQIGFVNLFSALAFAYYFGVEKFDAKQIEACLNETDSKEFKFEMNHLNWKKFTLTVENIETARRVHCATFGSCSLDEPDLFLKEELGL